MGNGRSCANMNFRGKKNERMNNAASPAFGNYGLNTDILLCVQENSRRCLFVNNDKIRFTVGSISSVSYLLARFLIRIMYKTSVSYCRGITFFNCKGLFILFLIL
jgi:hypothetical protein